QIAWLLILLGLIAMILVACGPEESVTPKEGKMALSVSSPVFKGGESIPTRYTCEGQDISPPVEWNEPPVGTNSLALICDDPDAPVGVFTHWVIFNLPADSRGLPEALPAQPQLAAGALQGKSDFGRVGYGGPCPPPGRPHRYQFTLYALDQPLSLKSGASKQQVLEAMEGHILAQGQLTGTYQR
ncbi:YbhB/YbcL family Raf kinase inhibitor-like protein, partial [Chloroflexota bacterium]